VAWLYDEVVQPGEGIESLGFNSLGFWVPRSFFEVRETGRD
jgi:hypothetical protein